MEFVKPKPIYPELTEDEVIANRCLWIDDLKTTDKPQCQGNIHNGEGYCCIGIAALRFAPKLMEKVDIVKDQENTKIYEAVRHYLDLPKSYGSKTNHDKINGQVNKSALTQSKLVEFNDIMRLDFKEIAGRVSKAWSL